MFSYNGTKWYEDIFIYYRPKELGGYPFSGMKTNYEFCKPLQKQLSFIQFLKNNDAYEAYMHNVKIKNQRWDSISCYVELANLKQTLPVNWILYAFNWHEQNENRDFWNNLNDKWTKICKESDNIV